MSERQRSKPLEHAFDQKNLSFLFRRDGDIAYPVQRIAPSPCTLACPAGVNVKAYVSLIAAGRFKEALQVVKERNPLPGICGRICTHPCESFCNRAEVDTPVAICWLKRFVADYELQHPESRPKPLPVTKKEKVAIIGSGPAGLTAANDLIRKGYGVTIFEALPEAGGMLIAGIPSFRLPRDIIQHEIESIRRLGVQIKTGKKVSGPKALDRLFEAGYNAIFIAVGAHNGKKLGIPGEEENEGVLDAISFLRQANLDQPPKLGKKVAVIGGGNSAIDAARTAVRMGSEDVSIVYRRTRKEMPAHEAEIQQAEFEGVKISYLTLPVEVLGKDGKVSGMVCTKMKLGKPDSSGRRRPIPIAGSSFTVAADTVIAAISQAPDLSFLLTKKGDISKWHTIVTEESTSATSRPGVFAGGDAVTGPNTVIDAIAAGHVAAQSIERYLRGEPFQQKLAQERPVETEIKPNVKAHKKKKRAEMPVISRRERQTGFDEVELGFNAAKAMEEAQRCLRCGPCSECFICVPECHKLVTVLSSPHDNEEMFFRLPSGFDRVDLRSHSSDGLLRIGAQKELEVQLTPTTCYVKQQVCRGCGDCVTVCEYAAPMLIPKGNGLYISHINENFCKGCGACVAVCPSSAIVQNTFSDGWLERKLQTLDAAKKNVVVFTCSWYGTHLDRSLFADISQHDLNLLFVRTTCSGRIEPSFILNAFEHSAAGVLVVGCPKNACHYGSGNAYADERFSRVQNMLNLLGFPSEKFQWVWPDGEQVSGLMEAVDGFLRSIQEGELSDNVSDKC
ncbi:MAG: NAD(P)-binding protein [bacterium]